jgi:WD40 repeat protein
MAEVVKKWNTNDVSSDIFAMRICDDGGWIAAALSNGKIGIFSLATGRLAWTVDESRGSVPTTSVRFSVKNPKNFLAVTADGFVSEWSLQKQPVENWFLSEEKNQLYALDISFSGSKFATAGLDTQIKLYDYETRKNIGKLEKNHEQQDESNPGHTNRIFSLIFHPTDPTMLISAGWDDSVQIWDLRTNAAIHSIFGPHICADSMDIVGNSLLTGSWRTRDQLQVWDLRKFDMDRGIKWDNGKQCLLYATRFVPGAKYFAAGGSGSNQVKLFSMETSEAVGPALQFDAVVFCLAFSKDGKQMVVGTKGGGCYCYDLNLP